MYNTLLTRAQMCLLEAEDVDREFALRNINYGEVLALKWEILRAKMGKSLSELQLELLKMRADLAHTHERLLELSDEANAMRANGNLDEMHWWAWEKYVTVKRVALWKQTPHGKAISELLSQEPNQILNSAPSESIITISKN